MKRGSQRPALTLGAWARAHWLPILTGILYLGALLYAPQRALRALTSGGTLLLSVALIIVAVIGLIGLLQVWISKDAVARLLGTDSGWMALLLSAFCGMILIGPPYLIFPLLQAIRKAGARWAVITTVLSTYAVKLQMIPLESSFLGWRFSLARSLLTVALAIPLGLLIEALMEKTPGTAGKSE
ncbi:MAG: permease [Desulfuromonadales bacterium]|nr:permease [Desulfuromonadales bacterium]MDT8422294.1 permease [Desulfuromonadales bacterium]